jgi:hypothetical protein
VLKNSFALPSASEAGAEYDVFVVCFGLVSGPFWTADRADNDFFNTLGGFWNFGSFGRPHRARARALPCQLIPLLGPCPPGFWARLGQRLRRTGTGSLVAFITQILGPRAFAGASLRRSSFFNISDRVRVVLYTHIRPRAGLPISSPSTATHRGEPPPISPL